MNADEFATRLAALAPAAAALIAADGVSESDAEKFRARYFCPRITRSDESDTLLDICNNFDLSSMKIGAVKLQRPSEFDRNYVKLGFFESDTIVYPKAGGIVSVRDHEDLRREFCKCARTAEGFLSALLVVAEFSTQCVLRGEEPDPVAANQALEQCLRLAGNECRPFYFTLVGVE